MSILKKIFVIVRTKNDSGSDGSKLGTFPRMELMETRNDGKGSSGKYFEFPNTDDVRDFAEGSAGLYEFDLPIEGDYHFETGLTALINWRSSDQWNPDFITVLGQDVSGNVTVETFDSPWNHYFSTDSSEGQPLLTLTTVPVSDPTEPKVEPTPILKKAIVIIRTATGDNDGANPSKRPYLRLQEHKLVNAVGQKAWGLGLGKKFEFLDIPGDEFNAGKTGIYEIDLPIDDASHHFKSGAAASIVWRSGDRWTPNFIVLLSQDVNDKVVVEKHDLLWQGAFSTDDAEGEEERYLGEFIGGN